MKKAKKTTTILFDNQIFNDQKFGGISRYFTEVIFYLKKNSANKILLPIVYTENAHYNSKFNHSLSAKTPSRILRLSRKINNLYKKILISVFPPDLYIPTYYDISILENKAIQKSKKIVTVYDMIHEFYSHYFPDYKEVIMKKKKWIESSDYIISISENTKKDILTLYPNIEESKIKVIHLSQSIEKSKAIYPKNKLPEKYILFVGNRGIYKNFDFLVTSIAEYLVKNDLILVSAGSHSFSNEEISLFKNLSVSDYVLHYPFEEDNLYYLYNKALCFCFPSLYEGFGIPVLEAMYSECPVVLSGHSSFLEVAEDAGVYYNSNNSQELILQIDKIINNKLYRAEIIKKGIEQSKKFSWEKTGQKFLDLIDKINKLEKN